MWSSQARAVLGTAILAFGATAFVARADDVVAQPLTAATKPADQQANSVRRKARELHGAIAAPSKDQLTFEVAPAGEPKKTTYLGVIASPAQPALQKQLQLKPGVGLVVDAVEPGSPAAQAGVREYDVLHKLDDQLLINNEQFEVLIRTASPGQEIQLTVIREGKPQALTTKLAEREAPPLRLTVNGGNVRSYQPQSNPAANDFVAFFDHPTVNPPRAVTIRSPDGKQNVTAARIIIETDRHHMTIFNPDGHRHLLVEDKAGKALFNGPIENEAQLKAVPEDLRRAYESIMVDNPAGVLPKKAAETVKAATPAQKN